VDRLVLKPMELSEGQFSNALFTQQIPGGRAAVSIEGNQGELDGADF
jgi:hypothetical protein